MPGPKTEVIRLRVTPIQKERLHRLAEAWGWTTSDLMRTYLWDVLIDAFLDAQEKKLTMQETVELVSDNTATLLTTIAEAQALPLFDGEAISQAYSSEATEDTSLRREGP